MTGIFLMEKDLISISDLTKREVEEIFDLTSRLKHEAANPDSPFAKPSARRSTKDKAPLRGKTLAMIFEKPSLRTRVTFEVGMRQLGGTTIYLSPQDIQLGKRESVKDIARNLSRWCDGLMARTFSHETILELSRYSTIPIINGLSDREHPCQALADIFTLWEKGWAGLKPAPTLAYIGDGNNVCHSLLLLCGILGIPMRVGCPKGYEPDPKIVKKARESITNHHTRKAGSRITSIHILHDPVEAVKGSDAVYTDVWTSMGQENETETRRKVFRGFQVNTRLLSKAKKDAWFMHCLPAHRGGEVTDEVLDGHQSIVLDQAENRLHVQKAILITLLE